MKFTRVARGGVACCLPTSHVIRRTPPNWGSLNYGDAALESAETNAAIPCATTAAYHGGSARSYLPQKSADYDMLRPLRDPGPTALSAGSTRTGGDASAAINCNAQYVLGFARQALAEGTGGTWATRPHPMRGVFAFAQLPCRPRSLARQMGCPVPAMSVIHMPSSTRLCFEEAGRWLGATPGEITPDSGACH